MQLPKTQETSKAWVTLLIGIVVVVLAVILFNKILKLGSGALEGLGLKDTKEEAANKQTVDNAVNRESSLGTNSYWSPGYYKKLKSPRLLNVSEAQSVAKQFWDSVGYLYDTPTQGAGALKRCATGAQLSQVADQFNKDHGLDLLSWLQNKYDTSEQKEILADMLRNSRNLPKQ